MAASGQTKSGGYVPITPSPHDDQKSSDAVQQSNIAINLPQQLVSSATTGPGTPGRNNRLVSTLFLDLDLDL